MTDFAKDEKLKPPYVQKLGVVKNFTVYSVDGAYVRNTLNDAFYMGGHSLYYDFIPANEIWVEKTIDKKEIIFIVLHELVENKLMSLGVDYDTAHTVANLLEAKLRKHHAKVKDVLSLI